MKGTSNAQTVHESVDLVKPTDQVRAPLEADELNSTPTIAIQNNNTSRKRPTRFRQMSCANTVTSIDTISGFQRQDQGVMGPLDAENIAVYVLDALSDRFGTRLSFLQQNISEAAFAKNTCPKRLRRLIFGKQVKEAERDG